MNVQSTRFSLALEMANIGCWDFDTKDVAFSWSPEAEHFFGVLLVEGAIDNQVMISLFRKAAGATVDFAEKGEQAIERATQQDYDLILMDLQMPVLDGVQATKRPREGGYDRPIIAVTAHAKKEEKENYLRNGFDDHMTKPLNRDDFIKVVATFARRRH